jgi:CO/xanthine dehydrogenase Mo-binding subunit
MASRRVDDATCFPTAALRGSPDILATEGSYPISADPEGRYSDVRRPRVQPFVDHPSDDAVRARPVLFMGESLKQKVGDAKAALATAPHKVDVLYTTPRHHHSPIELHACTLAWEGDTLRGSPMRPRR